MIGWWRNSEDARDALDLVDGSNPSMGVSVAMLGYHAIAKAQLEPLSKRTLVDAAALEAAYDAADFADVAEAVHAATCPALGHDVASRYAHSVVSEWTQRAKDSTGRLTQTLVNKGVPWPDAVWRASEVAGVPLTRLGRYATVAANHDISDLGVLDTADRVLMEYAMYRGGLESDLISKSGGRVRHRMAEREWDETEVRRDEAGRFAVENQQLTDTQVAERAQRREERAKRRARRDRRASRAAVAVEERQKTADTSTERQKMADTSSERTKERQKGVERAAERKRNGPVGFLGLPMMEWDSVPAAKYMNGAWVTVDTDLIVLEVGSDLSHKGQFVPQAFRVSKGGETGRLINQVAAYTNPPIDWVLVHHVPAGKLIVTGSRHRDDKADANFPFPGFDSFDWIGDDPDGSGLQLVPGIQRRVDVTSGALDVNGVPRNVIVSFSESEMVDTRILKSGRVRYRNAAQDPWNESSVRRDEAGRFAVENHQLTDTQAEERAQRRAARQKRRDRRERRTVQQVQSTAVERSRAADNSAERAKVADQSKERIKERQKGAERARERQKVAFPIDNWMDPVTPGVIATTQATLFSEAGLTADVYSKPVPLYYMIQDAEAGYRDFEGGQYAGAILEQARDEYGQELDGRQNSDSMVLTLSVAHNLFTQLSAGANLPYSDVSFGSSMLTSTTSEMMSLSGTLASGRMSSPSAEEVAPADRDLNGDLVESVAFRDQGRLTDTDYALLIDNHDRRLRAWTNFGAQPDHAIVAMTDGTVGLFDQLADLTQPNVGSIAAKRAATEEFIRELEGDGIHVPEGTTTYELLLMILEHTDLHIDALPQEAKHEIALEALSSAGDHPVRLDGIDVFRIY